MNMPEGSKDVYLSLGVANSPTAEGSAQRETYVAPLIAAQFANGVFIDMNTVGIRLSRQPEVQYGLQVAPTVSRVRVRTERGSERRRKITPEAGAFVRYNVIQGVNVRASLMYGGSIDHRGLRLRLGSTAGMPIAEHHNIGIDMEATYANRSALQADFAVPPGQVEAGVPLYAVRSGLRDVQIGPYWSWQLSTKYTLTTLLRHGRLHGSAAASPRTVRPGAVTALTMLTYQF
ncbi:MipA/OmpV family protein [Massilia sp. PAMC28688]|uniref:MipA/OmpV family protein n=1 Tax=Massilia sp. PAMC28688 TaxID=2861283 RepID=UPI001C6339C3|nr:MipA/OmpV family protein [Massilia sp. PAMC28688]QYF95629.1 MipA/OmpV family protein [Massilia sp. PAMC28688]